MAKKSRENTEEKKRSESKMQRVTEWYKNGVDGRNWSTLILYLLFIPNKTHQTFVSQIQIETFIVTFNHYHGIDQ